MVTFPFSVQLQGGPKTGHKTACVGSPPSAHIYPCCYSCDECDVNTVTTFAFYSRIFYNQKYRVTLISISLSLDWFHQLKFQIKLGFEK